MDEATLCAEVAPYEVVVVRSATKITKPVIDAGTNMKLVIRGGVGIDNIDAEYCKTKGVKVMNTPAASSASVAEMAIALMFSAYRFTGASNWRMKKGDDFKTVKKDYEGLELGGKTLGIVGIGRIGRELAKRALGLGMKVVAYDAFVTEAGVADVKMLAFDDLLKVSDFVSLHVPKTEKPVIGAVEIAKMKDKSVIINTSRGGAVDETALIDALNSGKLWGAGIDVWTGEPNCKPELVAHPKVSATPHLGASSKEAQERVGGEIVNIVKEMFNK
jgi:D-3-phosphoglycerate dehydrogenase / 2-oxoglutarate reductase